MRQLRRWQQDAFAQYLSGLEAGRRSLLWEATPGSGKTSAALEVALHQLKTNRASSVLVIVPTAHLRIQWAQAAAKVGLQLDSEFSGSRKKLTSDFQGAIVTYQQIGNREGVFKDIASRSVAILDEIHHAGDGLSWGNAVRETLKRSPFVLCLSGTAFRSDNNPIPFVHYDGEGLSVPDYSYPYRQAISDKVCRPTAVFSYGGQISWSENEKVLTADFSDNLDGIASARRLRSALDPAVGWIHPMFKDAHDMLLNVRKENPRAGGLFVCTDRSHARRIAQLVFAESGEKPTVVLSDDAGAAKKIKSFAAGNSMWLVACNMVSEGVDIPRLQVGVYGTTIRTKMYFRQFLGRIVRRDASQPKLQVAYLYLPAEPVLHQLATEIEEESRHSLTKKLDLFFEEKERSGTRAEVKEQTWIPVKAVNNGVDSVLILGNQLALFGNNTAPEAMRAEIHQEIETQLEERLTRSESKIQLSTEIKQHVSTLHRKSGESHSIIYNKLNKMQKLASQAHCTEQQLQERITLLEKMLLEQDRIVFTKRPSVALPRVRQSA